MGKMNNDSRYFVFSLMQRRCYDEESSGWIRKLILDILQWTKRRYDLEKTKFLSYSIIFRNG